MSDQNRTPQPIDGLVHSIYSGLDSSETNCWWIRLKNSAFMLCISATNPNNLNHLKLTKPGDYISIHPQNNHGQCGCLFKNHTLSSDTVSVVLR